MDVDYADLLGAIKKLLDRPIAFNRAFASIAGSVTAGLMLSQAFYWTQNDRAIARDGWFYKTQVDWQKETCLTRTEQENARKRLRERGLMEEELRGIPAKLYYRVTLEKIVEALLEYKEVAA